MIKCAELVCTFIFSAKHLTFVGYLVFSWNGKGMVKNKLDIEMKMDTITLINCVVKVKQQKQVTDASNLTINEYLFCSLLSPSMHHHHRAPCTTATMHRHQRLFILTFFLLFSLVSLKNLDLFSISKNFNTILWFTKFFNFCFLLTIEKWGYVVLKNIINLLWIVGIRENKK